MKNFILVLLIVLAGFGGLIIHQRVKLDEALWQAYDNELTQTTTDYWDLWSEYNTFVGEQELALVDIIPQVKPSVVHIKTSKGQASGFILGPHIIGTARHVVEESQSFEITLDDGTVVYTTRAISSKDHDFAYIWVEEELSNPVELGSVVECKLGQELFAIGSGYGKVNFNSVTKGIVSALDRDYDELNNGPYGYNDYGWSVAFQTDTPGFPGNSGCPVFTLEGKVVGVLVGRLDSSLVIVMPVDLFPELEKIELMFLMDEYKFEEIDDAEHLITQY